MVERPLAGMPRGNWQNQFCLEVDSGAMRRHPDQYDRLRGLSDVGPVQQILAPSSVERFSARRWCWTNRPPGGVPAAVQQLP